MEVTLSVEWQLAGTAVLFLLVLFVSTLLDRFQIHFIPESGVAILLGAVASGIMLGITQNIDDTFDNLGFSQNVFMLWLLPPIIFQGAYQMGKYHFFHNYHTILALAVVGTLISSFIIGVPIYLLSAYMPTVVPGGIPFYECMAFGSLISATDPVSSLAIYSSLGVDKDVLAMVHGESTVNDAIGIVMFQLWLALTPTETSGAESFGEVAGETSLRFLFVGIASPLIGVVGAILVTLSYKYAHFHAVPVLEALWFLASAFLVYMLAQAMGGSGIISLLAAGMLYRHYVSRNLSNDGLNLSVDTLNTIASFSELIVFLGLGVSAVAFPNVYDWGLDITTVVLCLLSRAVALAVLIPLANFGRARIKTFINADPISWRTVVVLWHAGVRGAVAYVLTLEITTNFQGYWMAATMSTILFTVFVLGGSTVSVLKWMRIPMGQNSASVFTIENVKLQRLFKWERKHVAPFLLKDVPNMKTVHIHDSSDLDDPERMREIVSEACEDDRPLTRPHARLSTKILICHGSDSDDDGNKDMYAVRQRTVEMEEDDEEEESNSGGTSADESEGRSLDEATPLLLVNP